MAMALESVDQSVALGAVVCLDGSVRAAEALPPAIELAACRGEVVSAVAMHTDRVDIRHKVAQQLAAVGLGSLEPAVVSSKTALVTYLKELTEHGATPVLSAFGRWRNPGRLYGVLGELIRSDVPRVVAVGPRVAAAGPPSGSIIVPLDNVSPAKPIIEATARLVTDTTPKIVVVHVVPPSEAGIDYVTNRDAAKFKARFDVPVEVAAPAGSSVSETIAELARAERGSLIIARSWHRSFARWPTSASSSLSIAAVAPCPVLIVN